MTQIIKKLRSVIEGFINRLALGMRAKLILLFVVIKVIPLIILTLLAWHQARFLGGEIFRIAGELTGQANEALETAGTIAINDSVSALNALATEQLERTTTDLARRIANFLYDRDRDILQAATLEPGEAAYRQFLAFKTRPLVKQREWALSEDGSRWVPRTPPETGPAIPAEFAPSSNLENNTNYHNVPPLFLETEERPLYLELTYLDLAGNELVKVTTTDQMDPRRRNVSSRLNTWVRAETYFAELGGLRPGEIYVSDVIGAYVRSRFIGMYTPENTAARNLPFVPEEEAYAGQENPNGRRFRGIIRWAAPVLRGGRITGYVTLALDHDHIMEFVDHITPMPERYVEMPSAYEGNYAFIWDYRCRNISHPRHHSIVGYDPDTGEPEVPWLEDRIYNEWRGSGLPYQEFIRDVPLFQAQSRSKRPAPELTAAGLVGLDGRYLNFAPQCVGWMDLTKNGGSGSFLILWSGIWKPNTAATIPYYTGNYGKTRRGFGFVAIGAGLEHFQEPAGRTKAVLDQVIVQANANLSRAAVESQRLVSGSLLRTMIFLGVSAGTMIVLVVLIAIWMASALTSSIQRLNVGISRFRAGERQFRFQAEAKDEISALATAFDEMADSLVAADRGPMTIIGMDLNIIYANHEMTDLVGVPLETLIGKPYAEYSLYPIDDSRYNPIEQLKRDQETDILFLSEWGRYIRGRASYLRDRDGKNIGYIITTTDVTEMVTQHKMLEQAVTDANRANEHKGEFLARMSHEIRTPMNAIIGMTNIVKKQLSEKPEATEPVMTNITQIEASSQHLLGLLNDILDISKIDAGKIELADETVDLLKLANTVATIIRPRCEEKNIAFDTVFDLPPGLSYICDPLRLRQVIINLLGNAVKFTPETGRIAFSIIRRDSREGKSLLAFSVRDTGIGIAENALATLFQPFEQANRQISQKYGGTGLGLSISKSIVQLFGGDISVQSSPGEGSEFSFELWLPEEEAEVLEEVMVEDTTGILKGKRALLVDDVAINRMIAISLLEDSGLSIDEAEDGAEALRIFSLSEPGAYDIIYMDISMPNMDGYEAASAIRALDREDAGTVPIVALTANAFKEDIDKALAHGMNAHLAKPMEPDKVLEVTLRLLGIT